MGHEIRRVSGAAVTGRAEAEKPLDKEAASGLNMTDSHKRL
jgi:hypothetical protein